jgi:hypothetical protein
MPIRKSSRHLLKNNNKIMEKKIVNVATEKQESSGGFLDDAISLFTLGVAGGSKDEGYVTTVTYDNGNVESAFGYTKEESIRNATK